MSRAVQQVFAQYRIQRNSFAMSMAELSQKPECIQQLVQQGGIILLRNLLTDSSEAIQQNAATAIGRLAAHSPQIAELILKQDIVRILLYFNMDKTNKYLKRAALLAIRSVVKHSPELAKCVIDIGGLDRVVSTFNEDFDPGVLEAAAWVCGYIARAVQHLIDCLKQSETTVRAVAASALSDVCKHSSETAQNVIDSGAITHLVSSLESTNDPKLHRQVLNCLAMTAKHSLHMAEIIVEAGVVPLAIKLGGHNDEMVRRAACSLIREIVKFTPEMSQLIVEADGLGIIVNAVNLNHGDSKLPGIMCLGYIGGHGPNLAMSVILSRGTEALSLALDADSSNGNVAAAAAWALGHIARHSAEHARSVSVCGLPSKILEIYMNPESTEEMKEKTKTALKLILFKIDDLTCVEPLLTKAPPNILKYVVALYSKALPKDPQARRAFVTSKGLQKLQELLTGSEDPILREHIQLINQCYPDEVVKYFSPGYQQTLLDRVEQYRPTLNIDPSLWSDRLFSDPNIPSDIREEILALQQLLHNNNPISERKHDESEGEDLHPPPAPPQPTPTTTTARKSFNNQKKKSSKTDDTAGAGDARNSIKVT